MTQTDAPVSKRWDRLEAYTAVMMTLISLVGAFVAYRASARSTNVTLADRAGNGALKNAQTTLTMNSTVLLRHYRAYSDYAVQETVRSLLQKDIAAAPSASLAGSDVLPVAELNQELAVASSLAAVDEVFFPSRYLNRDGTYAAERELAEAWAEAAQNADLEPAPHYAEARREQVKRNWLLIVFVLTPAALLSFNLSHNIVPERRKWKWIMAAAGTGILVGMLAALWIVETML